MAKQSMNRVSGNKAEETPAGLTPEQAAAAEEAKDATTTQPEVKEKEVPTEKPEKITKTKTTATPRSVATLRTMLREYATLAAANGHLPARRSATIRKFNEAIAYALRNPNTEVCETLYAFFVEENNALMDPAIALQDVGVIPPEERDAMICCYTMFRALVANKLYGKKFDFDLTTARNYTNSADLVAFVSRKLKEK